jgi:DNA-binding response OmpR family regulator
MRLLIIEDHPILADGLITALKSADYAVDHAASGERADHMLAAQHYDAVILDIGLPGLDGYEVLRRMRRRGSKTPVLMLTARDSLDNKLAGFDSGADDYLVKPFALQELLARQRALLRRGVASVAPHFLGAWGSGGTYRFTTLVEQARAALAATRRLFWRPWASMSRGRTNCRTRPDSRGIICAIHSGAS